MEDRKIKILFIIIKEHIKTGMPVSSGVLVNKYDLKVSAATVRNEMSELEEEGYIIQPHTSAGRIPTEKAYNFQLKKIKPKKVNEKVVKKIDDILMDTNDMNFKQVAKLLAELSGVAVFWAFHRHSLYYTGISNLIRQPEFLPNNIKSLTDKNFDLIYNISSIIDRMEEIIDNIYEDIQESIDVRIGSNNPFGNFCGSIMVKYKHKENVGLFGLLGPMRMDYEKNISILLYIKNNIDKSN